MGATDFTDRHRASLQAFIERRGLSVNRWAKEAGIPESTLRAFLSGATNSMTMLTYEKLAAAAGVTVAELTGAGAAPVQVIGAVQAGAFSLAVEWPPDERYPSRLTPSPHYPQHRQFALEVRGSSVNRLYPAGSQVLCIKFFDLDGRLPRPGDLVVVLRRLAGTDDREATLKYLEQRDGSFWLWPRSDDPEYQAPWKLQGENDGSADNDDLLCWALVIDGYRVERPAEPAARD